MDYHLFKKATKSKSKIVHRWYYYFIDPVSGKKIQKVCKNCKTQAESLAYVSSLPPLFCTEKITIGKIAQWMYIPGGTHMERLEKLGRHSDIKTLKGKRYLLNLFVEQFGDLELADLTIPLVMNFLMEDSHSGSWKNNFLTVVAEVYAEAPFHNLPYIPAPSFPKFRRNTTKKDILTTSELNKLFDENVWRTLHKHLYAKLPQYDEGYKAVYLLFLTSITCGLRLGEAIGVRVKQFLFEQNMFVVDGFYRYTERERTDFNKCGSQADRKLRVVPLSDTLKALIQEYITEQNLTADDFVFTRYGKPIRKHLAEKWFQRALAVSGIEIGTRKLTPHSLRYTYITRMRRDVAGETVQKLVGHTSIAMTDYYTRSAIPELSKAVEPARNAVNMLFE